MGRLKKIALGILGVFVLLIIAGALIGPSEKPTGEFAKTDEETTTTTQGIIIKSIEELIPTRDEISTVWIMNYKEEEINSTGFESGGLLGIYKLSGVRGGIFIDFIIYKFDTTENAKSYYTGEHDRIYKIGGFEEVSIPLSATCFTTKEDHGYTARFIDSYCYKKNVFFHVSSTSSDTFEGLDSTHRDMAQVLDGKIN